MMVLMPFDLLTECFLLFLILLLVSLAFLYNSIKFAYTSASSSSSLLVCFLVCFSCFVLLFFNFCFDLLSI